MSNSLGVHIEYLPPYSPVLNPIKEAFSKIKHWLQYYQDYYCATTDDGILFDMYETLEIITPEDAEDYFVHAGYFWSLNVNNKNYTFVIFNFLIVTCITT